MCDYVTEPRRRITQQTGFSAALLDNLSRAGFKMNSRYKSMVKATRDAIVCADTAGKITYLNPGADLTVLMPPRFRRAHRAGLKRFVSTGRSKTVGRTKPFITRRTPGETG